MQVMLNGRLFPVAEASSKKVAKKDAAAATLRILNAEMQGGTSTGDEGNTASMDQVIDLSPDTSVCLCLSGSKKPHHPFTLVHSLSALVIGWTSYMYIWNA